MARKSPGRVVSKEETDSECLLKEGMGEVRSEELLEGTEWERHR